MPPQDLQPTPQTMPTPEQPTPSAPQPAAQTPLSPLYETDVWHIPDGNFSLFGYRECVAVIYPGWLVVYRKQDHAELRRVQLTPDMKLKYFLNYVRFSEVSGQKVGIFSSKYMFFTSTIWSYSLFFVGVLLNLLNSILRLSYDDAANFVLSGLALLFMLASIGWMALGIPKSKAFIAACKHAAGIA